MCARAECAPGIDDDRHEPLGRLLPRRPDPESTDLDRPVERAPAVIPAVLDVGRVCAAEHVPQPLLALRVRVRRELDAAVALDLFESLGKELEHRRARFLDAIEGDLDGDSAQPRQRNALFSLSKKLSSWR